MNNVIFKPKVNTFVYYPNPHYSSPALTTSIPQLNPPVYLSRVDTINTDDTVQLRWYIQQKISGLTPSKSMIGPFVRTNHVWTSPLNDILRIPPSHVPTLRRRKKSEVRNNAPLESNEDDIYILPKGWGIKQLQEGLISTSTQDINKDATTDATDAADAKQDSNTFPAQQPHEVFTGLSDHYKSRGGKSSHATDGSFMGITKDKDIEGNWKAIVSLSSLLPSDSIQKKGTKTTSIDLGVFNDKLAAIIAHDQAVRHYYAELHRMEVDEDDDKKYNTNFASDADARRWSKQLKAANDKKRRRENDSGRKGGSKKVSRTSSDKSSSSSGRGSSLRVAVAHLPPPPLPEHLIRKKEEPLMGVLLASNGLYTSKVEIPGDGRDKLLGYFESERSAAEAHDRYMMATMGPNRARLNYETSRIRSRRGGHRGGYGKGTDGDGLNGKSPMASPTGTGTGTTTAYSRKQQERLEHEKDVSDIMRNAAPAVPSGGVIYRGVSYMYKCARWRACIMVKGKPQHLGLFRMAKEAALSYDEAALRLNGDLAVTNFDVNGTVNPTCTMGAYGGLYGQHLDRGNNGGSKLMDGGGGGGGAVDGGALPPLNWPRLGEEYQVDSTCIPICNVENQKKTSTLKQPMMAASMQPYVDPNSISSSSSSLSSSTSAATSAATSSTPTADSTSASSTPAVGALVTTAYGIGTIVNEVVDGSIQIKLPWCTVNVTSLDGVTPATNTTNTTTNSNSNNSNSNNSNTTNTANTNNTSTLTALSAADAAAAAAAAAYVDDDDDDAKLKDYHYGSLLNPKQNELPPVGSVLHTPANVGQLLARAAARQRHWTPREKQAFEIAMYECDKDFETCSTVVTAAYNLEKNASKKDQQQNSKPPTSRDCVEYYYCTWKLARAHRRWKQARDELTMQAAVQEHQRKQDQAKASRSLSLKSPQPTSTKGRGRGGRGGRGGRRKSKSNVERFCVCHGPGVGFMLGCVKCELWYHGACVGLGVEEGVVGDDDDFVCGGCSEEGEPTLIRKNGASSSSSTERVGLWPRRVTLWDNRRKMLISGVRAPTVKNLVYTLSKNRQLQVYYGEQVEYDEEPKHNNGNGQGDHRKRGNAKRGNQHGHYSEEDSDDSDDSDMDDEDEEGEERRRRKRMLSQERRRGNHQQHHQHHQQHQQHQQQHQHQQHHQQQQHHQHHQQQQHDQHYQYDHHQQQHHDSHHDPHQQHHYHQNNQEHHQNNRYHQNHQNHQDNNITGQKRHSNGEFELPGAKKARARRRVFQFCKQLDPWLRDEGSSADSSVSVYSSSGYSTNSNGYSLRPPPPSNSMFVQSSSSSLAAAASIGSSWDSVGWRAPIGAMSPFDDHINNVQPLEPLPELDPSLPVELQMREIIQKVQVCFFIFFSFFLYFLSDFFFFFFFFI